MSTTTVLNLAEWPRRHHLAFFCGFEQPHFQLTSRVDVTVLHSACKARGVGLFGALLYCTTRAANEETALRMRLRWIGDNDLPDVVVHDAVHPSFTAAVPLSEADAAAPGCDLPLFGYATARYSQQFSEFARRVGAASKAVAGDADIETQASWDTDDLLFVSSVPWLDLCSVQHAMACARTDSTPRIFWGRVVAAGERREVGLSLQAHHGLVDGGHVGRWFQRVSALVADPSWLDAG